MPICYPLVRAVKRTLRKSNSRRRSVRGGSQLHEDDERCGSQRDEILSFLEARGPDGATNAELNEIGFRYGARLWELRRMGWRIRTESLGDGLYKFTLLGKSPEAKPKTRLPKCGLPANHQPNQERHFRSFVGLALLRLADDGSGDVG